jgi:hypothetical protein
MTAAKKLTFNATAIARTGEAHRTEQQPTPIKSLHQVLSHKRPGRAPAFTEEVGRLNAFIPKRLLDKIQERAFREKKTISQIVADLIDAM